MMMRLAISGNGRFRHQTKMFGCLCIMHGLSDVLQTTAIALQQGEPSTCSALLERLRDVQGLEVDDVGSHPPGAPARRCSCTVTHPSHGCSC